MDEKSYKKPCKVICILEGIDGKYESNNYVHHDITIAASKHLPKNKKKFTSC